MQDFSRYLRQIALDDFSKKHQINLQKSKLVLIGIGGVGGSALAALAGAGVGEITAVDFDKVSISNLPRQTIYSEKDLGKSKTLAAKKFVGRLNSEIKFTAINKFLDDELMLEKILIGANLCIDATDSFKTRLLIAKTCKNLRLPQIWASAQGYLSQTICLGKNTDMKKILSDKNAENEKSLSPSIFGAAANISGLIAASVAIRTLAKVERFPDGRVLNFDLQNLKLFSAQI